MKNVLCVVALVAGMICGVQAAEPKTVAELRADYEAIVAAATTNAAAGNRLCSSLQFQATMNDYRIASDPAVRELATEADAKLSELGVLGRPDFKYYSGNLLPRMSDAAFAQSGLATNCPYVVALAQKYAWFANGWSWSANTCTLDELVGLLNEGISTNKGVRPWYNYACIESIRRAIQASGVKPVKRYLRSQGKSFVTKDGVNPCEGLMTELNTALNAPYFNGLNAWLEKMGSTARVDVSKLPSEAAITALKGDIMVGERDLKVDDEFVLKICLGVEGYNAFVKEYNGEQ